jgi:uncharacterized protein (DUF488 family)
MPTVFTIGHSNHPLETLLALLSGAGIDAVADVRSAPYSRRHPQFNREPLRAALAARGIAYADLGRELGGRPQDPALWHGPRPDYERMATAPAFCAGLERVEHGAKDRAIALMCAEREPLDCHRCVLVARALTARGTAVRHILADGTGEDHAATEAQLVAWAGLEAADMFASPAERLAAAYRKRAAWMWGLRPAP